MKIRKPYQKLNSWNLQAAKVRWYFHRQNSCWIDFWIFALQAPYSPLSFLFLLFQTWSILIFSWASNPALIKSLPWKHLCLLYFHIIAANNQYWTSLYPKNWQAGFLSNQTLLFWCILSLEMELMMVYIEYRPSWKLRLSLVYICPKYMNCNFRLSICWALSFALSCLRWDWF